jgi:ABC-type spermidine/putrescine transport system permease subunit II
VRYLAIALALIFALFPIWFIVAAAINPAGNLNTTFSWIPNGISLANYGDLTDARPFWSWYKNTLIIAGFGSLFAVFIGVCAAYAFSRLRFAGRRPGLMTLLLIQMFPSLLTFVALLRTFAELGDVIPQIGTQHSAGLILAYLGGAMGGNVWLLKGYFDTVPKELDEAAKVDGASHARIFFTITLPLITADPRHRRDDPVHRAVQRVPPGQRVPAGCRQPDPRCRPQRPAHRRPEQVLRGSSASGRSSRRRRSCSLPRLPEAWSAGSPQGSVK